MRRCTDREYVVIDATKPVRDFIGYVDSKVEDLSYNLEQVIRRHTCLKPENILPDFEEDLITEFLHSRIVKNEDDASVIAHAALYQLYPDITSIVRQLGYKQSIVHDIKIINVSRTRSIGCSLLMAVL